MNTIGRFALTALSTALSMACSLDAPRYALEPKASDMHAGAGLSALPQVLIIFVNTPRTLLAF